MVEPSQANTIYIGTRLAGVFKSTDDGNSWTSAGIKSFINESKSINSLVMDRLNPNVLYASTDTGIFKSTDGGQNWAIAKQATLANAVTIDPSNSGILYAGLNSGDNHDYLLKSTDGGASWSEIRNELLKDGIRVIAIDPANTNIVYAGTKLAVATGGVVAVHPSKPNTVYMGADEKLYKSTNGGESWTEVHSGRSSVTAIAIDPSRPSTVYIGNVNGIFMSSNGGDDWTPVNLGLRDPNILSIVIDPSQSDLVYASTSNEGVYISTNGGVRWTRVTGDSFTVSNISLAVDASSAGLLYAGTLGSSIWRRQFIIPAISSAVLNGPKKLMISGRHFGSSPKVFINGADRTEFIISASDTLIEIGGKRKKLKLRSGDNTIEVTGPDGITSNFFTLRL